MRKSRSLELVSGREQDRGVIETLTSFSQIAEVEWNGLEAGDFVFADHRFLNALEESGCLGDRTGWHPQILVAREEGQISGVLPLFVKTNSYGEFIFDWGWAAAAERAGLAYYPKLVAAIPFTPATGPKFLLAPQSSTKTRLQLLAEARNLRERENYSSLHFLFTTGDETEALGSAGSLIRDSFQFHWENRDGWKTFDDFLSALRSKRRSEIRRERESVQRSGLGIRLLTGSDLTLEHAKLMNRFYRSTIAKMGGVPYLTAKFFELLVERMPESLLFVIAEDQDSRVVAGALNLFRGKSLFGRYWGCEDDYKHLHFEVSYYAAIEWALRRGITRFEAGAQGEHKFNRGFTPSLTLSAHEFRDKPLKNAVEDFLEAERDALKEMFRDYRDHDPFKRAP